MACNLQQWTFQRLPSNPSHLAGRLSTPSLVIPILRRQSVPQS